MTINLKNFLNPINKLSKMRDFQDLDHLEGLSISAISANLYENMVRDDLTLFYFSKGAKYASLYTKNKIVSEHWRMAHCKPHVGSSACRGLTR